jgi:hypothetical protein
MRGYQPPLGSQRNPPSILKKSVDINDGRSACPSPPNMTPFLRFEIQGFALVT